MKYPWTVEFSDCDTSKININFIDDDFYTRDDLYRLSDLMKPILNKIYVNFIGTKVTRDLLVRIDGEARYFFEKLIRDNLVYQDFSLKWHCKQTAMVVVG